MSIDQDVQRKNIYTLYTIHEVSVHKYHSIQIIACKV